MRDLISFEDYVKASIFAVISPKYRPLVEVYLILSATTSQAELRIKLPTLEEPITTTLSYYDILQLTTSNMSHSSINYTATLNIIPDLVEKVKTQLEIMEKTQEFWTFIEKGPKSVK